MTRIVDSQRRLLDALVALKADKHHTLDTRTLEEIDNLILLLKQEKNSNSQADVNDAEILELLGKLLFKIPDIYKIFSMFFGG